MEVPTTMMLQQIKTLSLILHRDHADIINKEVFVSQVSRRLHETDLIRKANSSLLQYIANNNF